MKKKTGDDWFPFWIDKWIFGSTRDELTIEQCAVWVDFLALSYKDDGYIRANVGIPYPVKRLAGLLNRPEKLIQQTIDRCLEPKIEKLKLESDGTLYVISHPEYELSRRHKRRLSEGNVPQNGHDVQKSDTKRREEKILDIDKDLEEDTEILNLLSKVKNYPFNKEKDSEFIKKLKVEFPDVDVLEKVKQVCANWLDRPLLKKSRPRVQIRKWVTNEQKWQKEGVKEKKVGESTHIPSKKEDDYAKARVIKMKELQKKYQSERDNAWKTKKLDWLDDIDNKINEEIAEFSRKYHKEE